MTWDKVAEKAMAQLTVDERRNGVLYLDQRELAPNSLVSIDGREVQVRTASAMAFVDQEPRANWGHACRYMLIDLAGGGVTSIPAQFPPYLRHVPAELHVVFKGEAVPDWTVAKP